MSYIDKYGLWNVKLCKKGEPSGNDGAIITSYAIKLGFEIDRTLHLQYYNSLSHNSSKIPVERLPGKETPYPSRDSILGWNGLNLLKAEDLYENGWNFSPKPLPKLNLIQLICQLILCAYEDRNYFWTMNFSQVYRVAYSVPIQDRAFMLRKGGFKIPLLYRAYEAISKRLTPKNDSSKLIEWYKYGDKPDLALFERYFGKDHDFCKKIKGEL